ncbi:MAG TPA: uracil-DNA glycosylase [Methanomassiliicoccales archaeon]|nr:uracil-DNA glycosylase [Methanomassiliicoccales archaeon]
MSLDPGCRLCPLWHGRIQVVPPSGDRLSKVALVGEAPGANEDEIGRPFVGRAGRTLDKLMQEAGLDREKVMITNTVKCRPPENRRPSPKEALACRPYLLEELADKRLVLALGISAAEGLLGRKVVMKDSANKLFDVELNGLELKVMVTYHPSACIYTPGAKDVLREALRTAVTYL